MRGIYATGSSIYAATNGGLSISNNGGSSWTNYNSTTAALTGIDHIKPAQPHGSRTAHVDNQMAAA